MSGSKDSAICVSLDDDGAISDDDDDEISNDDDDEISGQVLQRRRDVGSEKRRLGHRALKRRSTSSSS